MLPLVFSGLSLSVSIMVAVYTLIRRGNVGMTRPALVGLLYDLPAGEPKVFFRTLLFATGKRGHIVESLYLKVRRGDSSQTFNFWMYGDLKPLLIGSGLRVTEDGVASNHHFLPPKGESTFTFISGNYVIEIYGRIVMAAEAKLLHTINVTLTDGQAAALKDKTRGVFYTWEPEFQSYRAHMDTYGDGV
jgi:hypothetical protein